MAGIAVAGTGVSVTGSVGTSVGMVVFVGGMRLGATLGGGVSVDAAASGIAVAGAVVTDGGTVVGVIVGSVGLGGIKLAVGSTAGSFVGANTKAVGALPDPPGVGVRELVETTVTLL